MTNPLDSPDWVSQQAPVARDTPIYAGVALPNNTFVSNIDVSKFASAEITASPHFGTSGDWNGVFLDSFANGNWGFQRSITFPSIANSVSNSSVILWRLPLDGDILNVAVHTTDPNGVDLNIKGSLRQAQDVELALAVGPNAPLLQTGIFTCPANGSTQNWYLPPTQHGYYINYDTNTTGHVELQLSGEYYASGSFGSLRTATFPTSNSIDTNVTVPVANVGQTLQVVNFTAAAVTGFVNVWTLAG